LPGVEVGLAPGPCPAVPIQTARTGPQGTFSFTGLEQGLYCVSLQGDSPGHFTALSDGAWTAPRALPARHRIDRQVDLPAGHLRIDNDFGWEAARSTVPPTPTGVPAPGTATPPPGCVDALTFVSDVTIADGSFLAPGASFTKTWRLRNTGSCTWGSDYALVFVRGDRLEGPLTQALAGNVAPGQTVDLSVALRAPTRNGTYLGYWGLRNGAGGFFGMGAAGDRPFWVQIAVGPTPTPARDQWRGEYFPRRDLSGTPALVRNDGAISFNWGNAAPADGLPADNFSVRWTRRPRFDEGLYRLRLLTDDGGRVYVDGRLVLDQWSDGAARTMTVDLFLRGGEHDLRVEYYERSGAARVEFSWQKIDSPSFSEWRGEYFFNPNLNSAWALVRNDPAIDFDWGQGAPAPGLPVDEFSVRWTRKVTFEPGLYRLLARADDGIRVYVDGQLVIDEWRESGGSTQYSAERTLGGQHQLEVRYFERSGRARVHFNWERVVSTPTVTATATPTATESAPPDTPTPTATPTATPPPQLVLVYDLVGRFCNATWRNAEADLDCPGTLDDPAGFTLLLGPATLEDGRSVGPVLVTQPQAVEDGRIEGTFPPIEILSGTRLKAEIGCLAGQPSCQVRFQIGYRTSEGSVIPLGSWFETSDGSVTQVDLDLNALSGQSVSLVLTVEADGSPEHDRAFWYQAALWRQVPYPEVH
jgi:single-stranded DNA-binding protein